ncbi:hypothetical protein THAOC_24438, partial [Thalassiosira oceanica]
WPQLKERKVLRNRKKKGYEKKLAISQLKNEVKNG